MDWKTPLAALARRGRKASVARRLIALDQLGRPAPSGFVGLPPIVS